MIDLFCRFPDEATAVAVAEVLIGREIIPDEDGKKHFSPDGWLENSYWNLSVCGGGTGVVRATLNEGTEDEPVHPVRDGFHVNGRWMGDELPEALTPFLVHPEHPAEVFG